MADNTRRFPLVVEVEISTAENKNAGSVIDIVLSDSADESTVETVKILCDHYEFLNLVKKRKRARNSIVSWLTKEISITEFVIFGCYSYAAAFVLGVVSSALKASKASK